MAEHTDIVKQELVVNIVPDFDTFEEMQEAGQIEDNELYYVGGEGSGSDHRELSGRDAADQHPITAIAGLSTALTEKQDVLTAGSGIRIENNVISATGGGGGTSDFDELTNRPSYNGNPMTHATDIPEVPTVPTTTNLLKGDGAGGIEAAVPGTDYVGETESVSELVIDTTVTEDSENLITSGAVFAAIGDVETVLDAINDGLEGLL